MRKSLKVPKAISTEEGIKFYSKIHKDYFSYATIDDKENIIVKWQNHNDKKEIKISKKEYFYELVKQFIIFLICFVLVTFLENIVEFIGLECI